MLYINAHHKCHCICPPRTLKRTRCEEIVQFFGCTKLYAYMHILNIVNVSALHIISALAPFSHFITENQNSLKIEASLRPTDCQESHR